MVLKLIVRGSALLFLGIGAISCVQENVTPKRQPPSATAGTDSSSGGATVGNSSSRTSGYMPLFGVGLHILGSPNIQPQVLEALSKSNLNSVRSDAPWKMVETTKGSLQIPAALEDFVNAATGQGLEPLLILDYGNKFYDGGDKPRSPEAIAAFSRYAVFVVNHFKGRVKYYEFWNEWDVTTGGSPPGSAQDYATLFNAVFPALKQADPSAAIIVCAGLHGIIPFYNELARLGVISKADGVAIHPYNGEQVFGPETSVNYIMELEQSMVTLTGRPSINIYVTEVGWPTSTNAYTLDQLAVYTSRMTLLLAGLPYVKGLWWYDLKNDGQDVSSKEDNFGLLNFDWSPKPAWGAYNDAVAYVHAHSLSLSSQSNLKHRKAVIDVKGQDGSKALIMWNLATIEPPLYSHCIPGAAEISSGPSAGSVPITNPTLVGIENGSCSTRAMTPGHVAAR